MAKEVIISNSRLNSYKFRVLTSGIDTTQFLRNPILLWMHNRPFRGTNDEVLPIGRVENLRVDGDNLIGTPVFDESDEFAKKIKAKFDAGFLKMVSAGIDVIETSDEAQYLVPGQTRATVTKSKLQEVSIVDLGANDDALTLYRDGKMVALSTGGENLIVPEITLKKDLNENNNKEMKTVALKLGLPETATEAEILAKIGTLQLSAENADTLQKEVNLQKEKAIEAEVDSAIKLKRITSDKRDHFVVLGKSVGVDSLRTTLELMSPAVKPTDIIRQGASVAGASEYKKLSDVPSEKRIELRKEDAETYKALYKAEYGFEPVID